MNEYRLPAWGIVSMFACVAALAVSEGNLVYTILFVTGYMVAVMMKQRLDISSTQEKWLSTAALIPLFIEQLFTDTHILHSLAHSLLLMVAIKLSKRKARREAYILYFTGFAVIILAASSTRTILIAFPLFIYVISTVLSFRQTVFGRIGDDWIRYPHISGAIAGSLMIGIGMVVFLPWLHHRLEFRIADYLGEQISIYSAFSGRSTFGDVGKMKLNRKIVLRVYTRNPERLCGKIFVRYTPEGWRSDASKARELLPDIWSRESTYRPGLPEEYGSYFSLLQYQKYLDKSTERMKIIMGTQTHRILFTPYNTIGVQAYLPSLFCDRHGTIYRKASLKGLDYHVYHIPDQVADEMKVSRMLIPGVVPDLDETLVIPQNLRDKLTKLSNEFVGDSLEPMDQARKIKLNLEKNYEYSTVLEAREGVDPVDFFLFHRKDGNCEMFASAMALLLRSRGIPSRYVTGFQVKEKNHLANYYMVREKDAHAWTEAYFEPTGWMIFDATPSVMDQKGNVPGFMLLMSNTIDFFRMKMQELSIKTRTMKTGEFISWITRQLKQFFLAVKSNVKKVLMFILFLLLITLLVRKIKDRIVIGKKRAEVEDKTAGLPYLIKDKGGEQLTRIRKMFHEFEVLFEEKGVKRGASRTLQEYIDQLEITGVEARYLEYGEMLVKGYQQCRYGVEPLSDTLLDILTEKRRALMNRDEVVTIMR